MNTIRREQNYGMMEKSRATVLTAGYKFVVWKAKIKKNAIIFRNSIMRFYF